MRMHWRRWHVFSTGYIIVYLAGEWLDGFPLYELGGTSHERP